jgi:hypothetical protein
MSAAGGSHQHAGPDAEKDDNEEEKDVNTEEDLIDMDGDRDADEDGEGNEGGRQADDSGEDSPTTIEDDNELEAATSASGSKKRQHSIGLHSYVCEGADEN